MALQAQVDYDALADKARGKVAPAPKKAAAVDYDSLADQARQSASATTPPPVSAAAAGAAGDIANPSPEGFLASAAAPFTGIAKGLKSAVYEGPQNPQEAAIVDAAQSHPSAWQSPVTARAVLALKRLLVDPQVDQAKQAASEFKQANSLSPWYSFSKDSDPIKESQILQHRQLAGGHALASVIPFLGPWAAQFGQKEGEQVGTGNYKGAAGTAVGNILLALMPKGVGKVTDAVPGAAEAIVRRMAGTGPGVARDLVRTVSEDNRKIGLHNTDRIADAQQNWQEAQAKALADHKAELLRLKQKFGQDTRDAAEKARTGTDVDRAAHQSEQLASKQAYDQAVRDQTKKFQTKRAQAEQANAEAAQKIADDNAKAAQKVTDANAQTVAKHQAVTQRVQTANQAAENMLELRRQHEQAYQQATDTHYAKEAAADTKAKSEENQAWGAWRQKTAGKTLDGGQISNPLQKLRLDSPEVDRTLNQLEPRGDEVPQESPYAQIREQTSQQHFGKDYQSLSPVKQDEIDDLLHNSGHSPEPIAFDPQAGQPISIDRVQRASSILQRYIRSGRFEGPLLGEMKQVAGVLRNAVTRASADAGAATELDSARNATITYQGAFGRELKTPTTARTIREQQVNPEAFKTREDEARLARARRYDPTLVDSYRQVKSAQDALDKLPSEDQLRKSLRQVPAPPTVGDTRSGFRLQPEAVPVKSAPKPLPAGANLPLPPIQESAPRPRAQNLPLPPILPDPEPVPYKAPKLTPTKTISYDDMQRANEAGFHAQAQGVASRLTRWAAIWPAFRMLSELSRTGETSLRPLAALPAAGAAGMGVEALLDHPGVREFFTKPTRQQIARIPPELRGQMPEIVAMARQRGVPISPLIAAYAASIQRQQHNRQIFTPAQAIQAMQPAPAGAVQ